MSEVTVTLANGCAEEVLVHEALQRVRARHDLTAFEFTHEVRIERGAIPHSHPVLTLSDRYGDDDDVLLTTYLHEQLHWWSMECPGAVDGQDEAVFAELERDFVLPISPPAGCGSRISNLIHLHVCWLELEALAGLIGDERAEEILGALPYYTAVYETVLRSRADLEARFVAAGMGLPLQSA